MEFASTCSHPVSVSRSALLCAPPIRAGRPAPSGRTAREGDPEAEHQDRPTAREGLFALWVLVLVAVALIALLLGLFSWITAALPSNELMACPEFEGCAAQALDSAEPTPLDHPQLVEPRVVP